MGKSDKQEKSTSRRFALTRNRSLSRDLTASLVVIVMIVATCMTTYVYWRQSRSMNDTVMAKANEIADRLAEILAVPIWNLDYENARLIGSIYSQNELIKGLRVYGSRQELIYSSEKIRGNKVDSRKVRKIIYEGRIVGRAEVDFTFEAEHARLERQMLVTVMLIMGSVFVILAVTGILLRVYLSKPLEVLQKGVDRVAKGDFSYDFGEVRHDELLGIANQFQAMSNKVEARERKLQDMYQTLQEAEEKYRGIFENAVEGMFQATPDGFLTSANPSMARIFGYNSLPDYMDAANDVDKVQMVNPARSMEFLRNVKARGEIINYETQYYRHDGNLLWVTINARAIYDDAGRLVALEGSLEDVTERKKAENELADINHHLEQLVQNRTNDLTRKAEELEQANTRLRELDELKSAFLSSVSHELRTPLTSILGFAKLLHRDFIKFFAPMGEGNDMLVRKGERIAGNLNIIRQEGERLTRLINDVLDLNKIESGSMGWRDATLDVNEQINKAVDAVRGVFSEKVGVALVEDVAPDLPKVEADADRIQQVLINLLNNALKFTDNGKVEVRASESDGLVRIEVQDSGVGIPSEDLEMIFQKFHQSGGETIKDKPEGTGLGLTICREIVEHYGGNIWATSTPGHGSTFIFVLPISGG